MTGIYTYKGNEYEVITTGKMKHPQSGEWLDCIIYKDAFDDKYYSREIGDFKSKFVKQ